MCYVLLVNSIANIEILQSENVALKVTLTTLEATLALLNKAQESYLAKISELENQVRWFKKQIFGPKSERRADDVLPLVGTTQLKLFELPAKPELPAETTTIKEYTRKKSPKIIPDDNASESGLRFGSEIEVKEIEVPNPVIAGLEESQYEVLGENVSEKLCQRKGSYYIERRRQQRIKVKESGKILEDKAPDRTISSPYADISVLVGMCVDKFQYHMPLYRQHQRMAAQGVFLSRGSLSNWIHEFIELFRPVYEAQKRSVLESLVLSMDETPHKAGRRNGGGKMSTCYYWFLYGDRKEVIIHNSQTRSSEVIKELLGNFKETLLTDGYPAYESIVKELLLKHANCWSHARRYFVEAEEQEPLSSKKAVDLIRQLYALEDAGPPEKEKLLAYRIKYLKPVVDQLFEWLKEEQARISKLPKTSYSKAVQYALNREGSLRVFLTNPDVPMDNNHTERAVRPIVLGRKNYLFCWTEVGAEKVAIIQSLIYTCQLHGINPWDYLTDVGVRVSTHPASKVEELTPRVWKQKFSATVTASQ